MRGNYFTNQKGENPNTREADFEFMVACLVLAFKHHWKNGLCNEHGLNVQVHNLFGLELRQVLKMRLSSQEMMHIQTLRNALERVRVGKGKSESSLLVQYDSFKIEHYAWMHYLTSTSQKSLGDEICEAIGCSLEEFEKLLTDPNAIHNTLLKSEVKGESQVFSIPVFPDGLTPDEALASLASWVFEVCYWAL